MYETFLPNYEINEGIKKNDCIVYVMKEASEIFHFKILHEILF